MTRLKSKAADADIKATQDEMAANRKAMMEQGKQFRDQRDAIFTPTHAPRCRSRCVSG